MNVDAYTQIILGWSIDYMYTVCNTAYIQTIWCKLNLICLVSVKYIIRPQFTICRQENQLICLCGHDIGKIKHGSSPSALLIQCIFATGLTSIKVYQFVYENLNLCTAKRPICDWNLELRIFYLENKNSHRILFVSCIVFVIKYYCIIWILCGFLEENQNCKQITICRVWKVSTIWTMFDSLLWDQLYCSQTISAQTNKLKLVHEKNFIRKYQCVVKETLTLPQKSINQNLYLSIVITLSDWLTAWENNAGAAMSFD